MTIVRLCNNPVCIIDIELNYVKCIFRNFTRFVQACCEWKFEGFLECDIRCFSMKFENVTFSRDVIENRLFSFDGCDC